MRQGWGGRWPGLRVSPCPAQCRSLCSWPARRQAWSALRSPGSWSWGPCWGPQLWFGPWLPGAGAGCAWLLATGRAACCPREGRKHLGVTFPGRWLPWRYATLGWWASTSQTSEPAAPLAHPALLLLCPLHRDSSSGQSSRARARLLIPVTGPQWLCSLAPVAQLHSFAFIGERGSSVSHGGAVPHPKGQPGALGGALLASLSPSWTWLFGSYVWVPAQEVCGAAAPSAWCSPARPCPLPAASTGGAGCSPPISASEGLWVTVCVASALEPGLGHFRVRLPWSSGLGRLARSGAFGDKLVGPASGAELWAGAAISSKQLCGSAPQSTRGSCRKQQVFRPPRNAGCRGPLAEGLAL